MRILTVIYYMSKMKIILKIIKWILILVGLMTLTALYTCHRMSDNTARFGAQKFDKEKWLQSTKRINYTSENCKRNRGEMTDDLRKNYLLECMSQGEILNLLGAPDYGKDILHWGRLYKSCLIYNLGIAPLPAGNDYQLIFCRKKAKQTYFYFIN